MLKSGMLSLMDAEARSQWAKDLEKAAVDGTRTFQYIATTWHTSCLKLWSENHADKILTCLKRYVFLRSSELRLVRWDEFNLKAHIWTVPAKREAVKSVRFSERGSKMKDEHLVPLSVQAVKRYRD